MRVVARPGSESEPGRAVSGSSGAFPQPGAAAGPGGAVSPLSLGFRHFLWAFESVAEAHLPVCCFGLLALVMNSCQDNSLIIYFNFFFFLNKSEMFLYVLLVLLRSH